MQIQLELFGKLACEWAEVMVAWKEACWHRLTHRWGGQT